MQIDDDGRILVFNRRTARDLAFKYVFQQGLTGDMPAMLLEGIDDFGFTPDDKGYIIESVNGVYKNLEEIDAHIEKYSQNRKKNRISNVCLAAMRIAIYEILYMDEIPVSVSINEAVELIKTYDSPETAAFANGILGKLEVKE